MDVSFQVVSKILEFTGKIPVSRLLFLSGITCERNTSGIFSVPETGKKNKKARHTKKQNIRPLRQGIRHGSFRLIQDLPNVDIWECLSKQ